MWVSSAVRDPIVTCPRSTRKKSSVEYRNGLERAQTHLAALPPDTQSLLTLGTARLRTLNVSTFAIVPGAVIVMVILVPTGSRFLLKGLSRLSFARANVVVTV